MLGGLDEPVGGCEVFEFLALPNRQCNNQLNEAYWLIIGGLFWVALFKQKANNGCNTCA